MKKIILFALSLCVLSCTKQIPETSFESTPGKYVIFASTESQDAKVSIASSDNTTFNHNWDASDQISVFDGTSNKQFAIIGGEGTASASFSGEELATTAPYYAVYPYSSENSIDGTTISVNYPATQTYRSGNYAAGSNVMIGMSTDGQKFNFKNACAYLQLNFSAQEGTVIKSVEISATDGEVIAGAADVTVDGSGDITAISMTGSGKIITVECTDGLDLTTAQSIYVPIPAVSLTSGFQVVVRAADYTSMGMKSSSVLTKNKVTKMPSIAYKGTWTAYGTANSILAYGMSSLNIDVSAHPVTYQAVAPEATQGGYRKNNTSQTKIEAIPVSAEIVWQEPGLTSLDLEPTVAGNTVQITNLAGYGNALIAIKDANGTILWNYVIWKPEMDPVGVDGENLLPLLGTKKLMKPFLGAMRYYTEANYEQVSGDNGLFYQCQRVEPISYELRKDDLNKNTYRVNYSSLIAGETTYAVDAAMTASRRNPDHIVWDWATSGTLWHRSGKSYVDPCPEGYSILNTNDFKDAVKNTEKIYTYEFITNGSSYGVIYENSLGESLLFDKCLKYLQPFKGNFTAQPCSVWYTGKYGQPTSNPATQLLESGFYIDSGVSSHSGCFIRCMKR